MSGRHPPISSQVILWSHLTTNSWVSEKKLLLSQTSGNRQPNPRRSCCMFFRSKPCPSKLPIFCIDHNTVAIVDQLLPMSLCKLLVSLHVFRTILHTCTHSRMRNLPLWKAMFLLLELHFFFKKTVLSPGCPIELPGQLKPIQAPICISGFPPGLACRYCRGSRPILYHNGG